MFILGLNDSNSAAAILKDGDLIAACREERFSRIKQADDFPVKAVDYCLKEAGIPIEDVDHIVFGWNPGHELEPLDHSRAIRQHKELLHYVPNNLLNLIGGNKEYKRVRYISERLFLKEAEMNIHFLPHHLCHAASAFFVSDFDSAAILTIDAYGDDITTVLSQGSNNHIEVLKSTYFPHSLGSVFAAVTQFLGFRPNVDEWKVMGMSAYGDAIVYYQKFKNIITFNERKGVLEIDLSYFSYYLWSPRRYTDKFIEAFGPERDYKDSLLQRHKNISAAFQKRVEEVVLELLSYLHNITGEKNLCMAGGVAMNSLMNGRIVKESPFEDVFIQPSSDDGGVSAGGCFYYWNQILKQPRSFQWKHDYYGPGYSNEEIKEVLDLNLIKYEYVEEIEEKAAQLISNNQIIGWFQGRMEFGQRALGNRSILADPRDPKMKDKVNRLIKHREEFRPFAPSVLIKYVGEYFDCTKPSPFMQKVFKVLESQRHKVPAITHKDGTGRLQTVDQEANPRFWKLIDAFRQITGVPMLLNTSFNDNDEPIVVTPCHALKCFYGTGMHALIMGNYLIKKDQFETQAI